MKKIEGQLNEVPKSHREHKLSDMTVVILSGATGPT